MRKIAAFLFVVSVVQFSLNAQENSRFDLDAYLQFLQEHENINYSELEELYPIPEFQNNVSTRFSDALYSDSVFRYYQFNEDEIAKVEKNGFMVTDRIRYTDFGEAYMTIYKRDLPVYISSDAILHAIHKSYSGILIELETNILQHSLLTLLSVLHDEISSLNTLYGDDAMMATSLKDMELYLAVPLSLLDVDLDLYFPENKVELDTLLYAIDNESAISYPLFSDVKRAMDMSQFTVRGHYTQSEELGRYFQAMMWLGRTELYIKVPDAIPYLSFSEDKRDSIAQRQTITSLLIEEAMENETATQALANIEDLLRFLVGESDNVMLGHLRTVRGEAGIQNVSELVDIEVFKAFQESLMEKEYAGQNILSQILVQSPLSPNGIQPASAFMLLGQRFVIDSYILANVVFDKTETRRMLPQSADAMFALGNNDALPILESEINSYNYGVNLAGLRYLIDSYEQDYWETSFFNLWLNTIRALNPAEERTELPAFTQNEAWSKKTLTTQMAAWAQIRHDNLLYAKQSYTGGPSCEFPYSYVEPNPGFFKELQSLAVIAKNKFGSLNAVDQHMQSRVISYFDQVEEIALNLKEIAQNELDAVENTSEQNQFLKEMLHEVSSGCATTITGWYSYLYYQGESDLLKQDYIVADVHTSPFDEAGDVVGWVMHIGTGPLNLAMIVTELADGNEYAFVGPVMSYYETVSVNFKRYTDEEWAGNFEADPLAVRPGFANDYLITSGNAYYDYRYLVLSSNEEVPDPNEFPQQIVLSQNYPNPFNAGTIIRFSIPQSIANTQVKLEVYSINGQLVETLIDSRLQAGNYSARWEPEVASGTYFYRLTTGSEVITQKMLLIK